MSAEDGDTENLQTHQPIGFLYVVDFKMDASAPRKWLGILTQRRVLYFGVFTEGPGRFFNPANCIYWIVAGMHQDPGGQPSSLDCSRTPSIPRGPQQL